VIVKLFTCLHFLMNTSSIFYECLSNKDPSIQKSIEDIKNYTIQQLVLTSFISKDAPKTFHQFEQQAPPFIRNSIKEIKTEILGSLLLKQSDVTSEHGFSIESIPEMNEIYVSVIHGRGSDKIFETPHIDGPFGVLPYCYVYRCVVGISKNTTISTSFPNKGISYVLDRGDWVAFDYNREKHHITVSKDFSNEGATEGATNEERVVIKLHYIMFPHRLPLQVVSVYKQLHIFYNSTMRWLFVLSQIPSNNRNPLRNILAGIICMGSWLYQNLWRG